MASPARARLLVLVTAVLFSTGGTAIKACSLTSWQVASFRSGIAALTLALCVPAARHCLQPRVLLVGLAYAATVILFVTATKLTTAANAIFLQSTAPLYVLVLGTLLLREPARRSDLLVMAVLGVGLLLFFVADEAPQGRAPDPLTGNVLALVSGLSFALTMLGLRWLATRGASGPGVLGSVVAGNGLAFLLALPLALPVPTVGPADAALLVFLGTVQIALAYSLLCLALPAVPALAASLLLLLEPALNPLWTWLVQGEVPAGLALLGGALILGATILHAALASRSAARLAAASAVSG